MSNISSPLLITTFIFFVLLYGCGVTVRGPARGPADYSGATTLAWSAPTTRSDGSPLTDLTGYTIYCGYNINSFFEIATTGPVTLITIRNLPRNVILYYAITATDSRKNESDPSEIVSFLIE